MDNWGWAKMTWELGKKTGEVVPVASQPKTED